MEKEILHFKIFDADARVRDDGGLVVRLRYPDNPEMIEKRLPENLEFGVEVFSRLIDEGFSKIADKDNPIKPASAGSFYLLKDGKFICNRRDRKSPSHSMYHSAYAGFPQSREAAYTAEGLEQLALRESAEECLLITRDKKPELIVPKDSKEYTLESARRLGIDTSQVRPIFVDVESAEPTDTLEVYAGGTKIFEARGFIEFLYESQTSLNIFQIRRLPLYSHEIFPVDAEGMMKASKFIHFNRESYIFDPKKVGHRSFGSILPGPDVYQTQIEDGIPHIYKPSYEEPYLGPDSVEVIHPHIWAPDDLLVRGLDALGALNLGGGWMRMERWKEAKKLSGNSLLPENVLAPKT